MALVYDANGFNVTANGLLANGATSKTLDCGEGTWTIAGNIQLSSGMTFTAGTSTVIIDNTSTITTGGKLFAGFTFNATKTYTLADDLNVDGTLTIGSGFTATVNGNNIKASSAITLGNSSSVLAGSTTLLTDGTGTLTGNSGKISTNWTVNTAGTLTLSGITKFDTGTLTYTAGTVDAGTSTLSITGSCTLNTNGIDWYNITHSATNTCTLSSSLTATNLYTISATTTMSGAYEVSTKDLNLTGGSTLALSSTWNVSGDLDLASVSGYNPINNNKIMLSGNLKHTSVSGYCYGDSTIEFTGTGSPTWTGGGNAGHRLTFDVNKSGGTLNLAGTIILAYGTFKVTAGTITPGTSIVKIAAAEEKFDLGANGHLNDLQIVASGVLTLQDDLYLDGDFDTNADTTSNFGGGAYSIYVAGDFKASGGGTAYWGAAGVTVVLNGTGTWSQTSTGGQRCNVTIDTTGTIDITGTILFRGTLNYVSGTVDFNTSLLKTDDTSSINTGTAILYDLQVSTAGTATLTGNATVSHTVTIDASRTLAIGSNTLTLQGADFINNGTFNAGTGKVVVTS